MIENPNHKIVFNYCVRISIIILSSSILTKYVKILKYVYDIIKYQFCDLVF